MKNIALAFSTVVTMLSVCQECVAAGALAIDEKQGVRYGWAIDYPSIELAQKTALQKCGDGCSIVFTFMGGAAAYVADQKKGSTVFAWGRAASADKAKKLAIEEAQTLGATDPIVRAWGVESPSSKSSVDSKVKVFVQLKLSLEAGKKLYAKGGWAQFVGWTYATPDELVQYGQSNKYVMYSDDITGARKNGDFLKTGGGRTSSGIGTGTPETSPIMKRFVDNVVKKHPLYAKREMSEYKNDVMNMWDNNGKKFFAYDGIIVVINNDWTFDQLKKSATFFEKREGGYDIVDAGEF